RDRNTMEKGKLARTAKRSAAAPVPAVPPSILNGSAVIAGASHENPGTTLTKSVYEQLRSDLLTGRLKPGEKLRAEALRHRFKVGSSPIREALNRLLSEGFVSLEEQKGFRVAPLSV